MGTNYYLTLDTCEHCGRSDESLHIGKSSMGWCFGLHVIPEEEIGSLDDWEALFRRPGATIRDECGRVLSADEMLARIRNRGGRPFDDRTEWMGYRDEADFHAKNHSERGPNGLLRRRLMGGHVISHGDGTWDCCIGEFS